MPGMTLIPGSVRTGGPSAPVVRTRIMGGVGNQLFQYAAGLFAARHWGAVLELDVTAAGDGRGPHPRRFMLDAFAISARRFAPTGLSRLAWKLCTSRRAPALAGALAQTGGLALLDEVALHRLDGRLAQPEPPARLVSMQGYWQCAAYADAGVDLLRGELAFRHPPDGTNAAILERIRATPGAVAVHVRRGDYLRLAGQPTLGVGYYRAAAGLISEQVSTPCYFVFSDTPDWAEATLRFEHPAIFVTGNGEDAAPEDLRLMSACRHHIIANSSFSWWGAWLAAARGGAETGITVAPKYWMLRADTHFPDLFPRSWQIVDNRAEGDG